MHLCASRSATRPSTKPNVPIASRKAQCMRRPVTCWNESYLKHCIVEVRTSVHLWGAIRATATKPATWKQETCMCLGTRKTVWGFTLLHSWISTYFWPHLSAWQQIGASRCTVSLSQQVLFLPKLNAKKDSFTCSLLNECNSKGMTSPQHVFACVIWQRHVGAGTPPVGWPSHFTLTAKAGSPSTNLCIMQCANGHCTWNVNSNA